MTTETRPSLTIRKSSRNWWEKETKITYHDITGDTWEDVFQTYFKEYVNRYKYCNDISFSIINPDIDQKYRKWISDINNYAKSGGDMW